MRLVFERMCKMVNHLTHSLNKLTSHFYFKIFGCQYLLLKKSEVVLQ